MAKRKKSNKSQNQQNQNQKRPRTDDGEHKNNQFAGSHGYIDPVTGQRGAFPGLDGDEDFFGPPMDGMDYLRMVR
jgi:predicted ester cyclase